jgi:hypothetical protein
MAEGGGERKLDRSVRATEPENREHQAEADPGDQDGEDPGKLIEREMCDLEHPWRS